LNFAEKEFLRQKELNQSQASSDKVFQLAESEYKTLRITLSSLAEKLKLINVNPNNLKVGQTSGTLKVHEAFTLDYRVKWPLTLIISKKAINKYQLIFRHLL
jgi:cobalt-zinc-cadmium efflux system membrane fusion protein